MPTENASCSEEFSAAVGVPPFSILLLGHDLRRVVVGSGENGGSMPGGKDGVLGRGDPKLGFARHELLKLTTQTRLHRHMQGGGLSWGAKRHDITKQGARSHDAYEPVIAAHSRWGGRGMTQGWGREGGRGGGGGKNEGGGKEGAEGGRGKRARKVGNEGQE